MLGFRELFPGTYTRRAGALLFLALADFAEKL